jgi:hypothetical protein
LGDMSRINQGPARQHLGPRDAQGIGRLPKSPQGAGCGLEGNLRLTEDRGKAGFGEVELDHDPGRGSVIGQVERGAHPAPAFRNRKCPKNLPQRTRQALADDRLAARIQRPLQEHREADGYRRSLHTADRAGRR